MGPIAAILPCGTRLHLQHGPIDLIIGADGDRQGAFAAATARFESVLAELVGELAELRLPLNGDVPVPQGRVARRMDRAARPLCGGSFVTRMAAVAGSVADEILGAMQRVDLSRAYVNNGGDIALHLTPGTSFAMAMVGHDGSNLGRIEVAYDDPVRGIATSGRHGRSHSMGVADSVSVLARDAASADVAATLIANAVDLPKHPAVIRRHASDLRDDSDLGALPVVVDCAALPAEEVKRALAAGQQRAQSYVQHNLIFGAALFLQGHSATTPSSRISLAQRTPEHA